LNRKGLFFLLPGLLLGILLGALILTAGAAPRRAPSVGEVVEEIAFQGLQQRPMTLSQFRGKVVLLNFWATWCVPCKDEMPLLQKSFVALGNQIVVVGVNSQESEAEVAAFLRTNQITFPIALDASGELGRRFMIQGFPTTYFIDASGVIRSEHIGALNETLLIGYLQTAGVKP
jgi:thiol-disulfide isomerase/thioredoxin